MARQNITKLGRRPAATDLMVARVAGARQVSPSFVRVTVAGPDLRRLEWQGADQWGRLFIPVDDGSALAKVPGKLTMGSYLRFLTLAKTERPLMRSYSFCGLRASAGEADPELDLEFVLHRGPDGEYGPAARWATECSPGDPIGLIDEGIGFAPPPSARHFCFAADETALPALSAILAGLPEEATGTAVIEIPTDADRRDLTAPAGVEVAWASRAGRPVPHGQLAIEAVRRIETAPEFGWAAGEAGLVAAARRHWVGLGTPKSAVAFCGYWRSGH
ncbi:MAG: siderophore-interacting protein [Nocardioides sp.]|uniref:siderophore-interacting protein n=1 Tax=Nocardioides sp. TaxID=35761 RepID=UPI0039E2BCA3